MNENKQKRKIVVSEKTYEKLNPALKDAIAIEGFEIEVVEVITAELRKQMRREQKDILVLDQEENADCEVLDFKLNPYKDKEFIDYPIKKQKMYVPKTIGKPISKKKGGR